ncbi:hypothetical protein O181_086172 [Austropuccinia psidii MF-1]|uniref:Uncharacterized protein n=1 Tax=Austropuccinia psidii MF-1 TaxID=1389203 RepID=A0A9Q3FXE6_9BASI|nr:hypothetical protein [Austropuccinia psidii MF-1]
MHIPEQLSRWGPLNGISEYGGERLVGILQKLKTNTLNGCSEQTIMKKFGQLQRLHKVDPQLHLAPSKKYIFSCSKRKILDDVSYIQLLKHLKATQPQLRDYRKLPHPQGSAVLRCFATEHTYLSWRFGMKLSRRSPNNIIYVRKGESDIQFAKIIHILELGDHDIHNGPILMVHLMESVKNREVGFEGVDSFLAQWKLKHLQLKYTVGFISVSAILGLGAYLNVPAWTLGYKDASILAFPIDKMVGLERFD